MSLIIHKTIVELQLKLKNKTIQEKAQTRDFGIIQRCTVSYLFISYKYNINYKIKYHKTISGPTESTDLILETLK